MALTAFFPFSMLLRGNDFRKLMSMNVGDQGYGTTAKNFYLQMRATAQHGIYKSLRSLFFMEHFVIISTIFVSDIALMVRMG